ncbi:MAG: hypothetical protein Sapg2KO_06810 [Saprospiraceae bacterium]
MASKKYQLTGFAKFFIVMLFLVPIAYLSAVYINEGESGINSLFNQSSDQSEISVERPTSKGALEKENEVLRDSIRTLNLDYQELKRQYRELEKQSSN